jgi:hypothetical protein
VQHHSQVQLKYGQSILRARIEFGELVQMERARISNLATFPCWKKLAVSKSSKKRECQKEGSQKRFGMADRIQLRLTVPSCSKICLELMILHIQSLSILLLNPFAIGRMQTLSLWITLPDQEQQAMLLFSSIETTALQGDLFSLNKVPILIQFYVFDY